MPAKFRESWIHAAAQNIATFGFTVADEIQQELFGFGHVTPVPDSLVFALEMPQLVDLYSQITFVMGIGFGMDWHNLRDINAHALQSLNLTRIIGHQSQ